MADDDRLVVALMTLAEASFRQGRAVERGDRDAAAAACRDAVVALDQALTIAGLPEAEPYRRTRYTASMNGGERLIVLNKLT